MPSLPASLQRLFPTACLPLLAKFELIICSFLVFFGAKMPRPMPFIICSLRPKRPKPMPWISAADRLISFWGGQTSKTSSADPTRPQSRSSRPEAPRDRGTCRCRRSLHRNSPPLERSAHRRLCGARSARHRERRSKAGACFLRSIGGLGRGSPKQVADPFPKAMGYGFGYA